MAKLAIVRSSRATTASAAVAIAAVKPVMACPKIEQLPAVKVWAEFKPQVSLPLISQRPHEEQLAAGLWSHLETVSSTQANLQAVEVIRINGRSRRKDPGRRLVDGYHRLHYWFEISADGCPFDKLNLITHEIEVSVHASEDEIAEKVDALARTVDSGSSVKKKRDYLTAAIREAFVGRQAVSKAYRLGDRVTSYLKRTIGDPADKSGPQLRDSVLESMDVHLAMDKLFAFVESNRNVKRYVAQVFHTGITVAIFQEMHKIKTEAGRAFAVDSLKEALILATTAIEGRSFAYPVRKLDECLMEVFCRLADPKIDARLHASGKGYEGFYTEVSKYMAPELAALIRAANRKK